MGMGERLDDGIEILKELVVGVRVIASTPESLCPSILLFRFKDVPVKLDLVLLKLAYHPRCGLRS